MQSILIVDDKKENLVALESLLDRPDLELVKADNGNDALRLLLKHLTKISQVLQIISGHKI